MRPIVVLHFLHTLRLLAFPRILTHNTRMFPPFLPIAISPPLARSIRKWEGELAKLVQPFFRRNWLYPPTQRVSKQGPDFVAMSVGPLPSHQPFLTRPGVGNSVDGQSLWGSKKPRRR